uniref:Uncharacterized protein n=1 Tax=Strigops habroptila TaxID=2489341 RepID=A0A672UMC7_STRHB
MHASHQVPWTCAPSSSLDILEPDLLLEQVVLHSPRKHQEISLNLQLLFLSCLFLYKRKLSRPMLWLWVRSNRRICTTPESSELFLGCLLYLTNQHHSCEHGNCTMEIPKTQLQENFTNLL